MIPRKLKEGKTIDTFIVFNESKPNESKSRSKDEISDVSAREELNISL